MVIRFRTILSYFYHLIFLFRNNLEVILMDKEIIIINRFFHSHGSSGEQQIISHTTGIIKTIILPRNPCPSFFSLTRWTIRRRSIN